MKNFKKIARFVIEIILTVSIVSFILIYVLSKTILNESYVLATFKNLDYYNKTYELLESNFEKYIQQSGLDEEILKNIVTKNQVEEDTKKIIISIYDGINEEVSIDTLKKNLNNNINKQIDLNNLNKAQKKAIDDFVDKVSEEYKATISNSDYEKQIHTEFNQFSHYIKKANKVLIIIIGISVILLIMLNLKRKYKIFTNIATSMFASGIILTIINIYINMKVKVQYLTILNEPISVIIRNIAKEILNNILGYGILLIAISLVVIVIANFIHTISKYKSLMQDKPIE